MNERDRHVEQLAKLSVDAAFHLYRDLGPRLLESVYETLLADQLERVGVGVDRQKPIDLTYRGRASREPLWLTCCSTIASS